MNSGGNQSRAQAAVWQQKLEIGTVDLEVVVKDWIIQLWSWTLQVHIKIWYSTKTMIESDLTSRPENAARHEVSEFRGLNFEKECL